MHIVYGSIDIEKTCFFSKWHRKMTRVWHFFLYKNKDNTILLSYLLNRIFEIVLLIKKCLINQYVLRIVYTTPPARDFCWFYDKGDETIRIFPVKAVILHRHPTLSPCSFFLSHRLLLFFFAYLFFILLFAFKARVCIIHP